MMELLFVAAAFAAVSSAPAVAADMAVKSAAVVARSTCPAAQWGGFYAGIHGASAYHNAYRRDQNGFLAGADEGNNVTSWGVGVGGQIGYNVVSCSTFWGVEVDGTWLSNDRQRPGCRNRGHLLTA